MLPLLISHLSIASSIGAGQSATSSALRSGTSGLRACGFRNCGAADLCRAGRGTRRVRTAEGACRIRLPQQSSCRNGAESGRVPGRGGSRRGEAWRATHRPVPRHQHLRHSASGTGVQSARCDDRGIAGGLRLPPDAQYGFARRVSSATAWYRRRIVCCVLRLRIDCQGFRQRRTHDRRRIVRCRRRGWSGLAVPYNTVWLPCAGTERARALPSVR